MPKHTARAIGRARENPPPVCGTYTDSIRSAAPQPDESAPTTQAVPHQLLGTAGLRRPLYPGRGLPHLDRVILIALAVATHFSWFSFSGIIAKGDWQYWSKPAMQQLAGAWSVWIPFQGLGKVNVQIQFYLFNVIWTALADIGLRFGTIERLTIFIPIAFLSFYAPFKLGTLFTSRRDACYAVSLFYASTAFLLVEEAAEPTIAFACALAPLVVYSFEYAWRSERFLRSLAFSSLLWIETCYEVRIALLVLVICIALVVLHFRTSTRRAWRMAGAGAGIYIGLNLFWVIPTLFGGGVSAIHAVTSRDVFGPAFFDLRHALSLSAGAWTGTRITTFFALQPVKPWLWAVPIAVLMTVVHVRRISPLKRPYAVMFCLVAVIGITLSKENGPPFGTLYTTLYRDVPLFDLYREASKFYLLTAVAYAALLTIGLDALLQGSPRLGRVLLTIVTLVGVLNLTPLITGSVGNLYRSSQRPQGYAAQQQTMAGDRDFYRVLWVPSVSVWSFFDINHPRIGVDELLSDLEETRWPQARYMSVPASFASLMRQSWAQTVLEDAAIRYIAVPSSPDESLTYYPFQIGGAPAPRSYYQGILTHVPWLQEISSGVGALTVFEVKAPSAYLAVKSVQAADIAPGNSERGTGYIADTRVLASGASAWLRQASGVIEVMSSSAYNSGWSMTLRGVPAAVQRAAVQHVVYDYLFNGWIINATMICRLQSNLCPDATARLTARVSVRYRYDSLLRLGLISTTLCVALLFASLLGLLFGPRATSFGRFRARN